MVVFSQNTYVPDDHFEQLLIDLGYDSGPLNDNVPTANISGITSLDILSTDIVSLEGIDGFTSLKDLRIEMNNLLTSVDLTKNIHLETLSFLNSPVVVLNLSQNTLLTDLTIGGTSIAFLNLSNNDKIVNLNLSMGILQTVDFKNGANALVQNFDATDNPVLSCFVVDDSVYSAANWLAIDNSNLFVDSASGCFNSNLTYVPDDNFEAALILVGWDDVADNYVLTANVRDRTELFLIDWNISDLTGIQDFVSLRHLQISENHLTSVDITNLTELITISMNDNNISSIDLTQNRRLVNLFCNSNNLTSIDLSNNPLLAFAQMNNNQITEIDVTNNLSLQLLYCNQNPITSLDLTKNIILRDLSINNTMLTSVDFRNGNNTIVNSFSALNNPDLTCFYVDNRVYSQTNWTNIDPGITFVETPADCGLADLTYVPDDNFEQALIDLGYDSGPLDDYVLTATIEVITSLDVSNRGIIDLTGIEDFSSLGFLNCSMNLIQELDFSNNLQLFRLECFNNQLTTLDITQNTNLSFLYASNNQLSVVDLTNNTVLKNLLINDNLLSTIDVTSNILLEQIYIHDNLISSIDVTKNTLLDEFHCQNNELSEIDVSKNTLMTIFLCSNNLLTAIDVTKNTLLEQFVCSDNGISTIDLSQNINLSLLHAYRNQLTTLDIINNTVLKSLIVFNNFLTSLDLSQNTLLEQLNCSFNQISVIDVSQHPALYTLELRNNLLTFVDIRSGNNTHITYYNTRNNPNLKCIFVDDATYSIATWTSIDASSTFVETEAECDSLSCLITVDVLSDITADNSYTLPSIVNGNYYTLTGGNGTQLFSGDVITTSQTIYIYNVDSTDPSCFAESSFIITINIIDVVDPTDPVDCTIPEFFTPNNDSVNDYWNVNCVISTITSINIFNRYGKLIHTLTPGGNGWNGTYQNRSAISNTYWYRINFDDGSKKRGFFSLKR